MTVFHPNSGLFPKSFCDVDLAGQNPYPLVVNILAENATLYMTTATGFNAGHFVETSDAFSNTMQTSCSPGIKLLR